MAEVITFLRVGCRARTSRRQCPRAGQSPPLGFGRGRHIQQHIAKGTWEARNPFGHITFTHLAPKHPGLFLKGRRVLVLHSVCGTGRRSTELLTRRQPVVIFVDLRVFVIRHPRARRHLGERLRGWPSGRCGSRLLFELLLDERAGSADDCETPVQALVDGNEDVVLLEKVDLRPAADELVAISSVLLAWISRSANRVQKPLVEERVEEVTLFQDHRMSLPQLALKEFEASGKACGEVTGGAQSRGQRDECAVAKLPE
eukprot:scaffold5143_cov119-Isochrysis_galbana.AAC.19